jgi:hypothetical protein
MPWVAAVVQQVLRRLALSANADQLAVGSVRLAKMATEPALAFVNDLHDASIRFRVPREQSVRADICGRPRVMHTRGHRGR